jgi:DNA-binding HxlR family transcriptional regulator
MEKKFRSSCVIASCLDLIGDKWSLLIIRDMLLAQKKTFKEFATSDEEIATNLLSSRLKIYLLTEKGLSLAPMILEIVIWSDQYVRAHHSGMNPYDGEGLERNVIIENAQNKYRDFSRQVLD